MLHRAQRENAHSIVKVLLDLRLFHDFDAPSLWGSSGGILKQRGRKNRPEDLYHSSTTQDDLPESVLWADGAGQEQGTAIAVLLAEIFRWGYQHVADHGKNMAAKEMKVLRQTSRETTRGAIQ